MKINQVRGVFKNLKSKEPTLLRIQSDPIGNVCHAEIHNNEGMLWIWPRGSKSRVGNQKKVNEWKRFSLERPDFGMISMERPAL